MEVNTINIFILNYLEIIRDIVEAYTGLDVSDRTRKRETVDARKLYCYLSREKTNYSLKNIGDLIGIGHVTVLFHCNTSKDIIRFDPDFRKKYTDCLNLLPSNVSVDEYKDMYRFHLQKARHFRILLNKKGG